MAQLHLYVPDEIAEALRRKAESRGLSLSKYLAELAIQEVQKGWPANFFSDVAGAWKNEGIERPKQPQLEEREAFR